MERFTKIDLHMHTRVSDGTDTPEEIIERVKEAGITLFSVTDHDASTACERIVKRLSDTTCDKPAFISGVEFSCKDEAGKYHILGYGYDLNSKTVAKVIGMGHEFRMSKLKRRLEYLKTEFSFEFSKEDEEALFALDNPGKPHIGNMMVKYGYAQSKEDAIHNYLNAFKEKSAYVRPEDAITAILGGGGIPVLAHPCYGRGDELVLGEEMDLRLKRLIGFGLKGVEAFYSGFNAALIKETLAFARKYDLYVTAGSDYHGNNKLVKLGDTNLSKGQKYPEGLTKFIEDVNIFYPPRG